MSTSCVSHPRLSNGEKSPLFSRLKNFLGDRKSAEDVYYRVINPSFREVFPNVRFDHNGEPLLEDLITQCGIGHNKSNEAMLDYLNSEYGTEPVPKTMQSAIELQNRAASFNINNPLNKRYSAELTSSGHDVSMEIVEATGNGRDLGKQQRFNAELNNQLVKLLNSWGADVAALTELEEASNINGVMDLSAGVNAATGLKEVIRISKRHRWSNVSAKQNVLSEEEQEILKNAPRDSQGRLLAPNGKPSNLTEKQYAQVRTKAFKNWFGDWENNPSEASKVVDENGEPLVVYHGTQDSFTTVDFSKSDAGQGFYAASDKDTAETYGLNNKYALFFNLKNPYIIEGFGQPWNQLLLNDEDYTEEELKQPYKLKRLSTRDIENFAKNKGYDGVIFKDIIDQGKYSGMIHSKEESYIQELLENSGEDYTYANSKVLDFLDTLRTDVFVVFDSPNQVKSATDNVGTFSITNDDIRYREVPNSSFESLDTEMQENLLKKGWTAEKFDSISQEERNQAVKCIAF